MKRGGFFPLLVIAAGLLAYHNSFTGAFLLDDRVWIERNPRIQHRPLVNAVSGTSRPVVQLSLALNYVVGGLDVHGYHTFNLVVHVLAGLTLYGIVRRTLAGDRLRSRYGQAAGGLALAVAVLWLVHPLQTESVTYIIQRAESLMGLFYLLTLYCAIRGAELAHGRLWYGAAVIACALGMGSKPVMVTAPLLVLLYDRAFLTGSFREALRRRGWLYSGLAATGLWLPVLLRNGSAEWKTTAGFAYQGVSPLEYALTQPGVMLYYLRLSIWPYPLNLYHGWPIAKTWLSILPPTVVVVILLGATAWAWRKNLVWGFVGAWFFLILAPTSSFIPLDDLLYEHRMYLSLAALVSAVVMGLYSLLGRQAFAVFAAVAIGLGFLTWRHNQDYRSEIAMRAEAVAQFPNDPVRQCSLGVALARAGMSQEAIRRYEQALRLKPDYADGYYNLGTALAGLGRVQEAIGQLEHALRLDPNLARAHNNLGSALLQEGRLEDAIRQYEQALRIEPNNAQTHFNLGVALEQAGKREEAIDQYQQALRIEPDFAQAHGNLGNTLFETGRLDEAIKQYQQALRLNPDYADVYNNLGGALLRLGRVQEAVEHFEEAVRIVPGMGEAHYNLGVALEQTGRIEEAIRHYEQALRLKPDYTEAQNRLARLRNTR